MPRSKLGLVVVFAAGLWAEDGKLTIYMAGKPVARESYSILRADGKIELNGTGNAQLGSMKISIDKFDLIEDDKFQPVSVDAKATLGQLQMAHSITFADGKAKDEINTGQTTKTKEDEVHPDTIVVNSNLPLFAWSILAMRAKLDTTEPQTFYSYVLGQAENPVTVVSKGTEKVEFANKTADLNHLTVTFKPSSAGDPVTAEVWVDDARRMVKIAVPAQNVEAYQDGYEPKPAPPVPAATEKQP